MVWGGEKKELYWYLKKNRLISTSVKALCFLTVNGTHTAKNLFELFLYAIHFRVRHWFTYTETNLQSLLFKKTILDHTIWNVRSFTCVRATSSAHDSVYNFLLKLLAHLGGSCGFHASNSPRCKCTKINGVRIVVHWWWIGALCMENEWDLYYNEL